VDSLRPRESDVKDSGGGGGNECGKQDAYKRECARDISRASLAGACVKVKGNNGEWGRPRGLCHILNPCRLRNFPEKRAISVPLGR
jgi:hypothetical protein